MSFFWEPTIKNTAFVKQESWGELDDLLETKTVKDIDRRYITRALGSKQMLFTGLLVVGGLLVLLGRAWQLQVWRGQTYRAIADGNRIRSTTVLAPRGLIVDRYGQSLTANVPRLSLALLPREVPADDDKRRQLFATLESIVKVDPATIEKLWQKAHIRGTAAPITLIDDIPLDQGPAMTVAIEPWPMVQLLTTPERTYPLANTGLTSLSHVLGYVGRVTDEDLAKNAGFTNQDLVGKSGLELQYDDLLRGKNGSRDMEVDALGRARQLIYDQPPVTGERMQLTIDVDLQRVTEQALRQSMTAARTTGGAAIAVDPRSGDVLTMVSLPSFDANAFTHGIDNKTYAAVVNDLSHPLFNRAVQGQYPAGSTIKPIYAAAALAEGLITEQTKIISTGGIAVGKFFFPDWKNGGHGVTDVRKAIAESVNTFFYTIAGGYQQQVGLGIERMATYLARFGLGAPTGIDLPGEVAGLIPTPDWKEKIKKEIWYIGDTYHVAIGQGDLLVTPLQAAMYTVAIANGGTLYQPQLVLAHQETLPGGVSRDRKPIVRASAIVSAESLRVVREGMRQTVTSGSARALEKIVVPVAGKTGTAQVNGKRNIAWFVGFAPYENPQIAVAVMLENAGEGSTFAVPVARSMFDWWANYRYNQTVETVEK